MTRTNKRNGLAVMIALLIASMSGAVSAQPSGTQVLNEMTDRLNPENSKGVMTQTIKTSSGELRTFKFENYSTNQGEKTLMRYISPVSVKGQAILMLNDADDIWSYFPRTKRVRKLATHAKKQKVQGSDFTYEDMGGGDSWKTDYTATNTGSASYDGFDCWKLQLIKKTGSDAGYEKIYCWVRQNDYFPLKIEYYDEGRHQKTLFLENVKTIEGLPTAMKMVMKNHDDMSQTIMEIKSVTYNWTPPSSFFTEHNLKK